jgi:hypothetical protein
VAEPTTEQEGWLPPHWAGVDRASAELEAGGTPDPDVPWERSTRRVGHGGDAAGSGAAVAPWEAWWEEQEVDGVVVEPEG